MSCRLAQQLLIRLRAFSSDVSKVKCNYIICLAKYMDVLSEKLKEFFLQKLHLRKSTRMVGLFCFAAATVIIVANTSTAQETGASPVREKEWAAMAALPDFSGVWFPAV